MFIFLFFLMISFSLGAVTNLNNTATNTIHIQKINTSYYSTGHVLGASTCTVTSMITPTTYIIPNATYTAVVTLLNDTTDLFSINVSRLFFQERGTYQIYFYCTDGVQIPPVVYVRELYVTENGNNFNNYSSDSIFYSLAFFILLFVGLFYITHRIDFKKWNDKILRQYQTRNFIKVVFGAIAYNIMVNSYVLYYLIGLPIISLLTELALTFNIESLILVMPVLSFTYTFGLILIGILFFSNIQEWIMDLFKQFSEIDWGIKR